MIVLPDQDAARLGSMLALAEGASNPADGERLAALAAAERLLSKHGLRLRDLVSPETERSRPDPASLPKWRLLVDECLRHPGSLRPWEGNFLRGLRGFPKISPKQIATLRGIAERIGILETA